MHTKLLSNLEWGTTFVLAALAPLAFAGDRRMKVYAEKGDPRQKGLAALFAEAQKAPLPPSQE